MHTRSRDHATEDDRHGFHYSFRDFVESGGDESTSPFLKPKARPIASWLHLPLALFSALLLLSAGALHLLGVADPYILSLIATVYFLSGTRSVYEAACDLLKLEININVLMTLAAYLCLIAGSYFEGALLLVLFDISKNMEHGVTHKARSSLMALRSLAPEKAWLVDESESKATLTSALQMRHVQDIQTGQLILVKAGEIVPLDGEILQGRSHVSLSHLTGEPLPLVLGVGSLISSGARTLDSPLLIRVSCPAQEATLTRIIRMIHEAQESKPQLQRLFDRLSDGYAKTIILFSGLIALVPPFLSSMPYWGDEGSIYRGLTFLIAASPCALILALPIAYLSALSAAAKRGIVIKASSVFDQLATCKQLAFDKTGTLTLGNPTVESIQSFGAVSISLKEAILSLEKGAKHPLAAAIVNELEKESTKDIEVKEIQLHLGYGMSGSYNSKNVRVGSALWAIEGIEAPWKASLLQSIEKLSQEGYAHSLGCNEEGALLFSFHDQLREGAKKTLEELHQLGFTTVMLTGDHEESALAIAKEVGVSEVHHSLKPEDKWSWIQKLRERSPLAMIGDGINDAPALAGATVGIAMGGIGSETATAVADVLLLHDEINLLPWLFRKSRHCRRIIWQNLFLASFLILFSATLALTGYLALWAAVIVHEGGTILVGLNGLRLMRQNQH